MKPLKYFRLLLGLLSLILMVTISSCEKQDDVAELEVQEDPEIQNHLSGDPDLLVVEVQNDFLEVIEGFNRLDMPNTRQSYMFGEYIPNDYANSPNDQRVGNSWEKSYKILENTQLLKALNDESEIIVPQHLGLAQILQAYALMLLVDHHGDVPYSEALDPVMFPNPSVDAGDQVYLAQLSILDVAISNLNEVNPIAPNDIYATNGFDKNRWIALANSLKLRAFLNMRLYDSNAASQGIQTLLSSNVIDSENEDFQFSYNHTNEKHPIYEIDYDSQHVTSYMSNSLFDLMNSGDAMLPYVESGIQDPRVRHYMYRQADRVPHITLLPCETSATVDYDYCHVGNSYWGRDHSDMEGIPPDSNIRTLYGLYPVGGTFDRDLFLSVNNISEGLSGAGIFPIQMSFFTQFMLAEASITLNIGSSPESYLEQGIRMSMNKVANFAASQDVGGFGMTAAELDDYVLRVLDEYSLGNTDERLHIIEREYYLASFGNGLETYNSYRRTGYPISQSPVNPAGPFPRVLPYATSVVVGNSNISQHDVTIQTFWDTNPAGFID